MSKLGTKLLNLTPILLFSVYLIWWIFLNFIDSDSQNNFDTDSRNNFTDTYSVIALAGAIVGLSISKRWGLLKSRFGKAFFYFALGLFFQFLGQLTYGVAYRLYDLELVSPSVGDIPYVLSYVSYFVGAYQLLKSIVFKDSVLKPWWVPVTVIIVLIGVISSASLMFLNIALEDDRGFMYQLLNVGYAAVLLPYFVTGLIALLQSKRMAGGALFRPVAVLLFALTVQFVADFYYLYQAYHETWVPASVNDIMFLSAYILMIIALIMIDSVRKHTLEQKVEVTNES